MSYTLSSRCCLVPISYRCDNVVVQEHVRSVCRSHLHLFSVTVTRGNLFTCFDTAHTNNRDVPTPLLATSQFITPSEPPARTLLPRHYTKPVQKPSVDTCASFASNRYTMKGAQSVGTAYFITRPPVAPLLLVPVLLPSTLAVRCSAPTARAPLEQNVAAVRRLLNELVTLLPLSGAASPPTSPQAARGIPSLSYKHSRLSSKSSLGGDKRFRCHVATQAHPSLSNQEIRVPRTASYGSTGGGEDWLGGVRALRDSHVRLVLRQLRHIDRLNRALDRVICPSALHVPRNNRVPANNAAAL